MHVEIMEPSRKLKGMAKDHLARKVAVIIGVCLVLAVRRVRITWRNAWSMCFSLCFCAQWRGTALPYVSAVTGRGWWFGAHLSTPSPPAPAAHVHSSTVPGEKISITQWQVTFRLFFHCCHLFTCSWDPNMWMTVSLKWSQSSLSAMSSAASAGSVPWLPSGANPALRACLRFFCCWFEVCCCPMANINLSIFWEI